MGVKYLPFSDMAKVYNASNLPSIIVAWQVKGTNVILYTGEHKVITVPFEWFKGMIAEPDFDNVEVVDCGQTLRLGEVEVGVDAVLAEFGAK